MRRRLLAGNRFTNALRGLGPTFLAIAGLVLAPALAETIGAALDSARARADAPALSPLCPEASPVSGDPVDPLEPGEAKEAAPASAIAPSARSYDHRALRPLRPSLKRARRGSGLAITGSRVTGTLATAPAGGFVLDDVVCMVPTQTTPAETPATVVNRDAALYANSAPDTDTIVRPTASGVTVVESLRGPDAPTSFTWRLGLPDGEELAQLARVSASALDSNGASAPAKLTQDGPDELTVSPPPGAEAVSVTVAAKRSKLRKPKPPHPVLSFPLIGIDENLPTEAANAACGFAQTQPEGMRLMLLNFGQARVEAGAFGAGRNPFHANDEILDALRAAADRYRQSECHAPGTNATIAYGVGNFKLSTTGNDGLPMTPELATQVGAAQLDVARSLRREVNANDDVAVAGDLEPGWDQSESGVEVGKALALGADTGDLTYYNFGTAGHCPPYQGTAPGCGSWRWKDLGEISHENQAVPLPEIYHDYQAKQWNRVRKRWNRRNVRKPNRCSKHKPRCYSFAGVTSEPEVCGSDFSAQKSWKTLRDAIPEGALGDELVFYNPLELNC